MDAVAKTRARLAEANAERTGSDVAIPYADLLAGADPLIVLAETPIRVEHLVRGWDAHRWAMRYAPGKWTGAQVVLHLAHDEIGWGNRARNTIAVDGYVAQPYDGARWVELETATPPDVALAAFRAMRQLNLGLYRQLNNNQRRRPFSHPEFGEISIDWIISVLAGHDLHHLKHLKTIAEA